MTIKINQVIYQFCTTHFSWIIYEILITLIFLINQFFFKFKIFFMSKYFLSHLWRSHHDALFVTESIHDQETTLHLLERLQRWTGMWVRHIGALVTSSRSGPGVLWCPMYGQWSHVSVATWASFHCCCCFVLLLHSPLLSETSWNQTTRHFLPMWLVSLIPEWDTEIFMFQLIVYRKCWEIPC